MRVKPSSLELRWSTETQEATVVVVVQTEAGARELAGALAGLGGAALDGRTVTASRPLTADELERALAMLERFAPMLRALAA